MPMLTLASPANWRVERDVKARSATNPDRFSIEPALAMTRGRLCATVGTGHLRAHRRLSSRHLGRRLRRHAEPRLAEHEGRAVRTLVESDYLLGVADETRLGALRFRWAGEEKIQAALHAGVPA